MINSFNLTNRRYSVCYTSNQMKQAYLQVLLAGCGLLAAAGPLAAQSWTLTGAATNVQWSAIASSADGRKLVATVADAGIWLSTNGGRTWTQSPAPSKRWVSIASSADGTRLAAAETSGGAVYTSANSGLSWTAGSVLNSTLKSVASSADGRRLVAAAAGGSVYTSTDSGLNWTSHPLALTFAAWAASSADGTRLVIAGNDGYVITSSDSGTTWNAAVPLGTMLSCVASSADGSKLVVGGYQTIYLSKDAGATWSAANPPNANHMIIGAVACSADGSRLVATEGITVVSQYGLGDIIASMDAGVTWTATDAPLMYWTSIASSADGNRLAGAAAWNPRPLVGGTPGGIGTSQTPPAPALSLTQSDGQFRLSWLVPSTDFQLQHSADLSSAGWENVPEIPSLNLTNLQWELLLSPVHSQAFYRVQLR